MADWPRITGRRVTELSPFVDIIERKIAFGVESAPETYHAIAQADYIAIVARTPSGQIPIVRQFRPALERFTWELPAGLVDKGEEPAQTARRELMEETGYPAVKVHAIGTTSPCTGRLSNWLHSFFIETGERDPDHVPEAGMEMRLVEMRDIPDLISSGELISQQHIGALFQAALHSFVNFSADRLR